MFSCWVAPPKVRVEETVEFDGGGFPLFVGFGGLELVGKLGDWGLGAEVFTGSLAEVSMFLIGKKYCIYVPCTRNRLLLPQNL